jgi:hypothetical protein
MAPYRRFPGSKITTCGDCRRRLTQLKENQWFSVSERSGLAWCVPEAPIGREGRQEKGGKVKKAGFQQRAHQVPIVCSLPGADKTFDAEMTTCTEKGICFTCNPAFDSVLAEGQTILFWPRGASVGGSGAPQGPDGLRLLSRARVLQRQALSGARGTVCEISVEYC